MGERYPGIRRESDPRVQDTETQPFTRKISAIYISPVRGNPMETVESVGVIVGEGLEGDRYPNNGAFSKEPRIPAKDRQVTLISTDGIARANDTLLGRGVSPFDAAETRRNLLVDVPFLDLNRLVGMTFKIGDVEFEGVELCEPCRRPAKVAGRPSEDGEAFEAAFNGKAGIRARVLSDGRINLGDHLSPSQ